MFSLLTSRRIVTWWRLAAGAAGLALSSHAARAQQFEPGYVVLAAGDTLRGSIENRYWDASPTSVRFQQTGDSIVAYKPAQLRRFCLQSGRCFVADKFPFDKRAENRLTQLTHGLAINQEPTWLFAEVLVEGPASLLRSPQAGATHYFVRREAQPYLELAERRYLRPGTSAPVEANNYVAQLEAYFGDCPAVASALRQAAFTAAGLAQVVQAYNAACSATRQAGTVREATASPPTRLGWNVGALLGGRYGSLALTTYDGQGPYSGLGGQNLDGQLHPQAGLYADLLLGSRRLGLHGELLAVRFGSQRDLPARNGISAGSYEWRGTQAQLRTSLRVFTNLNRRRQQVFVGLGFSQGWTVDLTSTLRYGTASASFLAAPSRTLAPYAELGMRWQRLTVALDACSSFSGSYNDQLGYRLVGGTPSGYALSYEGRYWAVGATVGYRLLPAGDKR